MSQLAPTSARPVPEPLAERIARAAAVFADRGWEATRVDEVARVTGIPRATLYYYFPGKEHILAHLLARTLAQMTVQLETVASEPGTGRERLVRLVHEHLRFIADHGPTYRLLFSELGKAAALLDIATGVDRAVLTPLRDALRAGVSDGSLRVEEVRVAASVVYGAVLVAGMEHLLRGASSDVEGRAEAVLTVVLRGLEGTRRRSK